MKTIGEIKINSECVGAFLFIGFCFIFENARFGRFPQGAITSCDNVQVAGARRIVSHQKTVSVGEAD